MTDEQTARQIVSDAQYNGELNHDASHEQLEAAIVRALQAARDEAGRDGFKAGYMAALDTHANAAVLRMCHEARMMNGIVDYSDPNATGVVRRVLGTLPVTIDGMVIGTDARVYWTNGAGCIHDIITQDMLACVNGLRLFPSYLHGSREAAEAAKEASK